MCGERFALTGEYVIGEHFKPSAGSNRRIKLANRSRCRIARIRKPGFPCFFAFAIDAFKNAAAQICLATHFDFGPYSFSRVAQFQRYAANRAHV